MSDSFFLKILATDHMLYEGEAKSIIFPAPDGEVQILAHHENVVVACSEGIVRIKTEDDSQWCNAVVGIGFVNVDRNTVTILVDTAQWKDEMEQARANEAMMRAQEQLRQDQSIQEYNISRASLARAMVRLSQGGNSPIE